MVLLQSSINRASGEKPILTVQAYLFPEKLIVEEKSKAINLAEREIADLTLKCDRSKLDQSEAGQGIVWKVKELGREWQGKKTSLGKNKEIMDAGIWGISKMLKVADE